MISKEEASAEVAFENFMNVQTARLEGIKKRARERGDPEEALQQLARQFDEFETTCRAVFLKRKGKFRVTEVYKLIPENEWVQIMRRARFLFGAQKEMQKVTEADLRHFHQKVEKRRQGLDVN